MIIPSFSALRAHFPGKDMGPATVKQTIGGAVNASWITNTCVIRVSRAFNGAGANIPGNIPGLSTVRGGDGKRYAYRVAEFHRFLVSHVRAPNVEGDVSGKQGVIEFVVKGWSDATGHFDLWDGNHCLYSEYFDKASAVYLWTC
jgi:hypothetical protein